MSKQGPRPASKRGGERTSVKGSKGAAGPSAGQKPTDRRPARQAVGERRDRGEPRGGEAGPSRLHTPWPSSPGDEEEEEEEARPDEGPQAREVAKEREGQEQASRRESGKDPGEEGRRAGAGRKAARKEQRGAEAPGPSTAPEGEVPIPQELQPALESAFGQ
ncbi:hypothetical protein chiPu_0027580, partial [Chiloscyllium punctatum]|nr:hypothetical protein [Chiloscyllium punctatum]